MNTTGLTGTRRATDIPTAATVPTGKARHTPKRRKPTRRDTAPCTPREALACITAIAATITALAVVAPHLADNTTPDPRDWGILLAMCAILSLIVRLGHRNRRR